MDIFIPIIVFGFGLIIGSFLNCFVWRLYKSETLGGRSYCPKCHHQINWYDNLPVLSFFLLQGRCRYCREAISWQYPLVELSTALLFLATFMIDSAMPDLAWLLARDWLFISALTIVFVYDLRWQLIPMNVVWATGIVIFLLSVILGAVWWQLLVYAAIGAGFFLIQYLVTKKRGVGEGDIWLGALLGLSFPTVSQLMLILVLSYGLGSIVSLGLLARRKKGWKSRIALGPFLAIGAIITLIWGERLINWYLGLF
ncbi:MAG: prepilin peptidase [Patescibacteria group bacterium]|jgi:prepilin signal peptidase PulO-like enzyme (type II secretory pathway)